MRVALILIVSSVLFAQQAPVSPGAPASQPEPLPAGVIRGMVVDVTTQEPMPNVLIQVIPSAARPDGRILSRTDDEGKFTVEKVSPGRWSFFLYRNGFVYLETAPAGMLPRESVVEVGPGQVVDDLVLGLHPAAVINGRVVDEDGVPMEGMLVEAVQYHYVQGSRQLVAVGRDTSDDRGEYRIHGLDPGDYYVRVNVQSTWAQNSVRAYMGGNSDYVDTYYPNVQDVEFAGTVGVTAEAETVGIEFRMARTRALSVSGRIVDPSGRSVLGGSASLFEASSQGRQFSTRRLRLEADGTFQAEGLTPGRYRIEAIMFTREVLINLTHPQSSLYY